MLHHKPRIEERTKVMVRAHLRSNYVDSDVCVLDISTRGLSASTASPPARGEFVSISIGANTLVGHVKWSGERRFGIAFRERVSVIAAISGEGDLVMPTRRVPNDRSDRRKPAADERSGGRKIELLVFAVAAGMATVLLADLVASSLGSLQTVEAALASGSQGKGVH